jgi:macrolide transport system ATP-binding/permease protein
MGRIKSNVLVQNGDRKPEHSNVIEISNVRKTYRMGDSDVRALAGVSLTIARGDFVAIMGPSGSGKSTLMHILGLLDSPDSGTYVLTGMAVETLGEDALAARRSNTIGFIFQQFNLLSRTSAVDNVALPSLYRNAELATARAGELLKEVGLGKRLGHHPNELSGGQQQRVAIARALMNDPEILLADEPTGNLDSSSSDEIMNILQRLNERGITVILVTHEEDVAARAHRIIRMKDGLVQSDERRREFVSSPTRETAKPLDVSSWQRSVRDARAHVRQAITALSSNKVRSGLSMLGILIGVAAVVAMLAIGQGAKESIEKDLSSMGSNLLVVMPGSMRPPGAPALDPGSVTRFTIEDAREFSKSIPYVKQTSPSVSGKVRAAFGNKNWSTSVTGAEPEYASLHASPAQVGRFFDADDGLRRARVAVIGTTVARQLFGKANPVGEYVKLNKISFQVIGILKAKGAQGFRDQDDNILIPLSTAMHRLLGKDFVDQIDIEVSDASKMASVEDDIRALVIQRHRLPPSQEESFDVRNMAEIQAALTSTSKVMSGLLACIAAISLLVGGIGIMNIMLVSVTERTREIGLRKALGARRNDILRQFLVEAIIVSALGGLLGVLTGTGITLLVTQLAGWAVSISLASVTLSMLFSATIGVVFGLWPARKAADLSPIKALRYE